MVASVPTNKMDLNNIATVFGPTLMATPPLQTGQTDVTFHFQIQGQVLRAILGEFFFRNFLKFLGVRKFFEILNFQKLFFFENFLSFTEIKKLIQTWTLFPRTRSSQWMAVAPRCHLRRPGRQRKVAKVSPSRRRGAQSSETRLRINSKFIPKKYIKIAKYVYKQNIPKENLYI